MIQWILWCPNNIGSISKSVAPTEGNLIKHNGRLYEVVKCYYGTSAPFFEGQIDTVDVLLSDVTNYIQFLALNAYKSAESRHIVPDEDGVL